MPVINVYTDGGSRGNPGPAAAAYIVKKDNVVVGNGAKFLGIATNNIAEYSALILALTWLTENKSKINNLQINFFLDSLLVVNQINGVYKVKNANLFTPFNQTINLLKKLDNKVKFIHVTRDKNKEADNLVNVIFDEN